MAGELDNRQKFAHDNISLELPSIDDYRKKYPGVITFHLFIQGALHATLHVFIQGAAGNKKDDTLPGMLWLIVCDICDTLLPKPFTKIIQQQLGAS